MTEAEAIADVLDTIQDRIRVLLAKYGDDYPDLWENYTLVELLYLYEFHYDPMKEERDGQEGHITRFMELAAEGRLTKFPSIHRALTIVKKEYQTPDQRRRSADLEESWGEAMTWRD